MNLSQKELGAILDNIEEHKSYYAGGTLCVDGVLKGDVLMFNLDETVFGFVSGIKSTLSIANVKKVFSVYKEFKGFNSYYVENFKKSCIRHLDLSI